MGKYVFIGLGGFFGCIGRYLLVSLTDRWTGNQDFPYGTLLVNLAGCFLIGALSALFLQNQLHPNYRLFFIVGLLGGFTTFSSFSLETLRLLQTGRPWAALVYAGGSLILGLVLTLIGHFTARGLSAG